MPERRDRTPQEVRVGLPNYTAHPNRWDALRAMPTVHENVHESIYRAYHVLDEVQTMLGRGDSRETVEDFLRWVLNNG